MSKLPIKRECFWYWFQISKNFSRFSFLTKWKGSKLGCLRVIWDKFVQIYSYHIPPETILNVDFIFPEIFSKFSYIIPLELVKAGASGQIKWICSNWSSLHNNRKCFRYKFQISKNFSRFHFWPSEGYQSWVCRETPRKIFFK